jgi:hypothetical protein
VLLREKHSERGMLDMLPLAVYLVVVPITSFHTSVRELEFLLFDGETWALSPSVAVGSAESLCTVWGWGGRPLIAFQ